MTATESDHDNSGDLGRADSDADEGFSTSSASMTQDAAYSAMADGDDVVVFSASSANTTVFASMRETWRYRGFIGYMTRRHLRITYLRSYLGWFWSLLNPIAEVAIYSFVFGALLGVNRAVPNAPNGFNSFPHFLLSGLAIWVFFRTVSSKVLNSFNRTVRLRRKLYFPPAAAAVSAALGTMVESGVLILAVIGFFGLFGHLSIHAVVLIPAALFAATSGLGVGLALSVVNSRYQDVGYLYAIVLRLGFYLLPVLWPIEEATRRFDGSLSWVGDVVGLNPFAQMIGFGRAGILFQEWPGLGDWLYLTGFSLTILIFGWAIFARTSADVAEGL